MNKAPKVTESNYPTVSNCQQCGSFFHDKAVRVQYPSTQNPKLWKTFVWYCQSCASALGYK
ncbi:hypothetical protein SEA_ZENITSU_57 [Microbacterium phage Zenitsu]|uniref:Uncharacterized protein n=1 Tax=Microbacterium phage MCubed TaxID=2593339 RepID=A0A514U439_9CAUD|nr:hypothetical protein SEA_MCUBED_57 [Microbacterium phage MCubed]WNN93858.1 hypothetical protein SEA_ZENITSU_57 [Microbacterium phage Zenitsu]